MVSRFDLLFLSCRVLGMFISQQWKRLTNDIITTQQKTRHNWFKPGGTIKRFRARLNIWSPMSRYTNIPCSTTFQYKYMPHILTLPPSSTYMYPTLLPSSTHNLLDLFFLVGCVGYNRCFMTVIQVKYPGANAEGEATGA